MLRISLRAINDLTVGGGLKLAQDACNVPAVAAAALSSLERFKENKHADPLLQSGNQMALKCFIKCCLILARRTGHAKP